MLSQPVISGRCNFQSKHFLFANIVIIILPSLHVPELGRGTGLGLGRADGCKAWNKDWENTAEWWFVIYIYLYFLMMLVMPGEIIFYDTCII